MNDALCFISRKFVTTPLKLLKSALMDFYTAEVLSEAKVRLIEDINSLNLSNKPPHIPLRRNAKIIKR